MNISAILSYADGDGQNDFSGSGNQGGLGGNTSG